MEKQIKVRKGNRKEIIKENTKKGGKERKGKR